MSADEPRDRRKDDTRIALLEQAVADIKGRDSETQKSLGAVHKRISETRDKLSRDMKEGFEAVMKKMDDHKNDVKAEKVVQDRDCKECAADITTLKENRRWLYGWLSAVWTAIIGMGLWIFGHASNVDQEAARAAAEVLKKLKGGG